MNGRPERGDAVRPWIAKAEDRYPDEWEPIRRPQVRKAISMAKRVRKVVLLNLPREFAPPKR
jgi:hypothetical protein